MWEGPFLNASGAWAARGGSETNPETFVWEAPETPPFGAWEGDDAFAYRFLGYRLDDNRQPLFLYELRRGDATWSVEERPAPYRRGEAAGMVRHLTVEGPAGSRLPVNKAEGTLRGVRGETSIGDDGHGLVGLDGDGKAEFELEISW